MTDQSPSPPASTPAPVHAPKPPWARRLLRGAGRVTVRGYALVILLVLLWTGYAAVVYLVRTVFLPAPVPEQFLHWQARIDDETLRQIEAAGVTVPAPRAPLDHYHGIDRWFQPDPHNGCSSSGCHSPLPHGDRKEVRAFANLHATFMTCRMCHAEAAAHPAPAMWVSTASGTLQDPPALLQLTRLLEVNAEQLADRPAEIHPAMVRLLSEMLEVVHGDPVFEHLLVELNTTRPGSPVWRQAVRQLTEELPGHARGDYAAKLTPRTSDAEHRRSIEQLEDLARQYHAAAPESRQRRQMHEQIHRRIVAKPDSCLACHGEDPPRLDFEAAGYSPTRSAALRAAPIPRMIQNMREGQPFHLPGFMGEP